MKKILFALMLIYMMGIVGCTAEKETTDDVVSTIEEDYLSIEEPAIEAYSKFLSGDRTLLDEKQLEMWYIPNFQDAVMKYEYIYLDLDGDDVVELLVQLVDDPCGYNAVFHFEDGKIVCWNSDAMEMSCRDYPLKNGIMVRQ